MFKDAIISALFGALGPFFNKQATFNKTGRVYSILSDANIAWAIYPFNLLCIALMLTMNTISVKHKLMSYKNDGAFLGTSLIFSLGYLFSSILDIAIGESYMPLYKYLGVVLIIFGVMLITFNGDNSGKVMKTQSVIDVLELSISKQRHSKNMKTAEPEEKKGCSNGQTEPCETPKEKPKGEVFVDCEIKGTEFGLESDIPISAITPHLKKAQKNIENQFFIEPRKV